MRKIVNSMHMPYKHTFDATDTVEELWLKYEKVCDASFTKTVNNALDDYLRHKLKMKKRKK